MKKIRMTNLQHDLQELLQVKGMTPMEAIIHWCEENKIEIEHAAQWIKKNNPALISSLQEEAEDLHFIKKTARLPV